mgnify:CR=1 FL=1
MVQDRTAIKTRIILATIECIEKDGYNAVKEILEDNDLNAYSLLKVFLVFLLEGLLTQHHFNQIIILHLRKGNPVSSQDFPVHF